MRLRRILIVTSIIAVIIVGVIFLQNNLLDRGLRISADTPAVVDPRELILGCLAGKDCIPSIDNPQFTSVKQADQWVHNENLVLVAIHNGITKAYPIRILNWHEIVNDDFNGVPVAVTYCPLCNSGAAFIRILNGAPVEFGVSGRLRNSDLVMFDRTTETLWQQITGEGLIGSLAGELLEKIPVDMVLWGDWKEANPDAQVLSRQTGFARDYNADPYDGYKVSDDVSFGTRFTDQRLRPKENVIGVVVNGQAKAYTVEALNRLKLVNDELGGEPILLVVDSDSGVKRVFKREFDGTALEFTLKDGALIDLGTNSVWNFTGQAVSGELSGVQLEEIISDPGFWFAWAAFFPETDLFNG
ncbi:MAG: DUF3179 domain-containing protein [Candidatus Bipolaricaulia bacterium]